MLNPLTSVQKFQSGSDLWMMFFEPQRKLFKHINWRTSFLLQKINSQSVFLKPVLIDTSSMFPNKSLLCLPFKQDTWYADIYNYWKQFDKPSLRVFLPLNCEGEQLNQHWPIKNRQDNLFYYEERQQ